MRCYQAGRVTLLSLTPSEAAILRSLLCFASPVGGADYGELSVEITSDTPAPNPLKPHKAVETR